MSEQIKECTRCGKSYITGSLGLCLECLDKDLTYLRECNVLARAIKHENPGLIPEASLMIEECLKALKDMLSKKRAGGEE